MRIPFIFLLIGGLAAVACWPACGAPQAVAAPQSEDAADPPELNRPPVNNPPPKDMPTDPKERYKWTLARIVAGTANHLEVAGVAREYVALAEVSRGDVQDATKRRDNSRAQRAQAYVDWFDQQIKVLNTMVVRLQMLENYQERDPATSAAQIAALQREIAQLIDTFKVLRDQKPRS